MRPNRTGDMDLIDYDASEMPTLNVHERVCGGVTHKTGTLGNIVRFVPINLMRDDADGCKDQEHSARKEHLGHQSS